MELFEYSNFSQVKFTFKYLIKYYLAIQTRDMKMSRWLMIFISLECHTSLVSITFFYFTNQTPPISWFMWDSSRIYIITLLFISNFHPTYCEDQSPTILVSSLGKGLERRSCQVRELLGIKRQIVSSFKKTQ